MGQQRQRKPSDLSARQAVAWELLEESETITEVLYGGAAGGGKSWLGCLWQMYRRCRFPNTRGAIGRAELKRLRMTTLKTFDDLWSEFGRYNPAGVSVKFNAQTMTYQFSNGSEIVCLDLYQYPSDPDFASLGSLEITDAFIDEATEITEKAFQILSSRIRYRLSELPVKEPKILLAGNPANNWVKFRFVADADGLPVNLKPYQAFVPALLMDNPDPEFRRVYSQQLEKLGDYDRRRLLYGDWNALPREGGEAYWAFDPDKHTAVVPFLPEIPVCHLSFDQNVVPYITMIACQCRYLDNGTLQIRIFKEYCLKHPRNKTQALCEAWALDYGSLTSQVYIYGDASGNKSDTRAAQSDYDIALNTLRRWAGSRSKRVQRSNPEVRKRVLFICAIFEGKIPGVELIIDRNCHNLVQDLMLVKEDANGGKVKKRVTENGVSFEQYGHTSDALEYLVTTLCPAHFKDFEKLTR